MKACWITEKSLYADYSFTKAFDEEKKGIRNKITKIGDTSGMAVKVIKQSSACNTFCIDWSKKKRTFFPSNKCWWITEWLSCFYSYSSGA